MLRLTPEMTLTVRDEKPMSLNTGNQKNRVANGSRCKDHPLPALRRTGSKNGRKAQQAYQFRMAGVVMGEQPVGSSDVRSKISPEIVPDGET